MLVPEPEYPLNLERKAGDDHDDDSGEPPQPSVYNEDGSLEVIILYEISSYSANFQEQSFPGWDSKYITIEAV